MTDDQKIASLEAQLKNARIELLLARIQAHEATMITNQLLLGQTRAELKELGWQSPQDRTTQ